MKAVYVRRLTMVKAVLQMLKENAALVATLKKLAANQVVLENLLKKIEKQNQEQELKTNAEEKQLAAKAAIQAALIIISAAKAYAMDENKTALLAIFNYSESSLDRLDDHTLVATLKLIKDNADLIAADIEDYGADASDITNLETLTKTFETLNPAPRNNRGKKKTATTGLDASFKELTVVMKKMDCLVKAQRKKHPHFCMLYFSVRVVGHTRSKSKDEQNVKGSEPPALPASK